MANKIITVFFTSLGIPQVGLTPSIDLYLLNATDPSTNNLLIAGEPAVEIGGGWYRYDFAAYDVRNNYVYTFDGGLTLESDDRYKYGGNESYIEDISSEVWDSELTNYTLAGSAGLLVQQIRADTQTILINEITMTTLLNTLLKYERNRTEINIPNATLTIYDDDCITPLTVFDLRDFNGMPSVQEVCQRVPQGGNC